MLLNTIPEIKEFLPIGIGNDFNRLKPHILNAETKFILPLLGISLYEELEEFYDAELPPELSEVQQATADLLSKVQHATIHLAYFVGYDFLNVSISDQGFQRIESEHKKGLFKYQENNLKEYFSDSGFNTLDSILVFLEENITHFNEFKLSPNWTILKSSFIPTVQIVEQIPFNIFGSRLTFLSLKPHISFIEDTDIRKVLGEDIYQEIKTGMVADTPIAKITAILPYIRKPLIYLASAMLMEETGATLGKNGLFFDKITGSYENINEKSPSSDERIMALVNRNRYIGNSYLDALKSYLIANLETWTGFSGEKGSVYDRNNTDKKTFWA